MDLLKWLFGDQTAEPKSPAYYQPFPIQFELGRTATGVRTPVNADPQKIMDALTLRGVRTAFHIAGGAGSMDAEHSSKVKPMMADGLARFADDNNVAVIDGGTDSGVMKIIGDARREHHYTFPLIGIAPVETITFPGYDNAQGYPCNAGHSHFVLTDGDQFGQESEVIAELTRALAEQGNTKSVGVIINGGEITRQETRDRALTPHLAYPLIVLAGSGRFADELALAKQGVPSQDTRIREILEHSEVHILSIEDGVAPLTRLLTAILL